jgi:hypothetical protein
MQDKQLTFHGLDAQLKTAAFFDFLRKLKLYKPINPLYIDDGTSHIWDSMHYGVASLCQSRYIASEGPPFDSQSEQDDE